MPANDHITLLRTLSRDGLLDSRSLQESIGKSQATVSRIISDLAGEIISIGHGRATKYAIQKSIHSQASMQPLYWTSEAGRLQQIGTIHYLEPDLVCVQASSFIDSVRSELPWYLTPLKMNGFLGRLHAQRLAGQGLGANPNDWNLQDTLYAAMTLSNPPGAIQVGDMAPPENLPLLIRGKTMPAQLDCLADDIAQGLPAGSSAGGEQPKMLLRIRESEGTKKTRKKAGASAGVGGRQLHSESAQVIVKFSPPLDTPFGRRWHDLLHAEALTGAVLADYGFEVAQSYVISSARRTYLVSERFDRVGKKGRRHVVSIGAAYRGLVKKSYVHWASAAYALAQHKRLDQRDADCVLALQQFGSLIGNTDMHSGNLSLFVTPETVAKGTLGLAPVYDMLPMCWKPVPAMHSDLTDYPLFEPDERSLGSDMAPAAREFWVRLAENQDVGSAMRRAARGMARRIEYV